jgi:hypothetical protein
VRRRHLITVIRATGAPQTRSSTDNRKCVGGVGHLGPDTVREFTQRTLGPVDRHHRQAAGGEGHRRRVTKRAARTGHDRHLCAHGANRPRSAAVTCSPGRSTLLRIMNSSF